MYMTGDCFEEMREKNWIIWKNGNRPIQPGEPPLSFRRSHDAGAWRQIYRISSYNIDANVKFHVTFPRRKMTELTFVHSLLNEMDLNITRVAIYNNAYHTGYFYFYNFYRFNTYIPTKILFFYQYLYRRGGIDLFEAYYDAREAQARETPNLSVEELDDKTEELEMRCTKYISRLDYEHFCQFTTPLDQMSYAEFSDIKSKYNVTNEHF